MAAAGFGASAVWPGQVAAGNRPAVGHWMLDENGGVAAADSSTNASHGVITGASWVAGSPMSATAALGFDGVDDGLRVPRASTLEPTDLLTLSLWVRSTVAPTTGSVLIEKGGGGADCGRGSYGLYVSATGLEFSYQSSAGHIATMAPVPGLWDGAWHHLSIEYYGYSAYLSVFLDATLVHGANTSTARPDRITYTASLTDLMVGRAIPAAGCQARASAVQIDELRVYDRTLLDEERAALTPSIATTTVMTMPEIADARSQVDVTIDVPGVDRGKARIVELTDAGAVERSIGDVHDGRAVLRFGPVQGGTSSYRAEYLGAWRYEPSASATKTIQVPKVTTSTSLRSEVQGIPDRIVLYATTTLTRPGPVDHPWNKVHFYETTSGSTVWVGALYMQGDPHEAEMTLQRGPGTYTFFAKYFEDVFHLASRSLVHTVIVGKRSTATRLLPSATSVMDHHSLPVTVTINGADEEHHMSGTVKVRDADTGVVLATAQARVTTRLDVPLSGVGQHRLEAVYSGNDVLARSVSSPVSITVTQDIVEATGVGVDRATFYPVVDTYLDKLGIKGNRLERASVAVSIYSPGGTRVRTLSKAIGTGRYSIAWDGRNSGGTLLAAGRYRIVQTLTDAYGTRKSFTAYSTISRRKMIFTTYTRTVSGRSYAASGTSGSGSVSQGASNFANGVRISGSSGWAAVGYQFTVPAAQFYKTVTFKLQGWSGVPPGNIGLQDWGDCASAGTWNEDCFGAWRSIGSSTAWYPTSGTSSHVSDRRVRGIARVETGMIDIANVAVVVVYGNLD